MKLGLGNSALQRIGADFPELKGKVALLRRCAWAPSVEGPDWRDLQDISRDINSAVQQKDLYWLMQAVEDMTGLLLAHIQMPEGTDVSQVFPQEGP